MSYAPERSASGDTYSKMPCTSQLGPVPPCVQAFWKPVTRAEPSDLKSTARGETPRWMKPRLCMWYSTIMSGTSACTRGGGVAGDAAVGQAHLIAYASARRSGCHAQTARRVEQRPATCACVWQRKLHQRDARLRDKPAYVVAEAALGQRVAEAAVAAVLNAQEERALVAEDVKEPHGQGCLRVDSLHDVMYGDDLLVRVARRARPCLYGELAAADAALDGPPVVPAAG